MEMGDLWGWVEVFLKSVPVGNGSVWDTMGAALGIIVTVSIAGVVIGALRR